MAVDQAFLVRMAQQLVGIAGKVIAVAQTDDGFEDVKRIQQKHYDESMKVAKKIHKLAEKEQQVAPAFNLSDDLQKKLDKANFQIDMTEEKVEKGTSCLPCSRDHFSVASGLLEEALRFAKRPDEGLRSPEVKKRVQKALLELNNLERVDLASENVVGLQGKERELADWTMNASAKIRHDLTSVRTPDDLVHVAAEASKAATKLNDEVWDLTLSEDNAESKIDDICRGLTGDALETCRERVRSVIDARSGK